MQLTVSGKGNAAPRGGINGDLLVVIEELPDENLIRNGNDLIYNLLISVPMAAMGGEVVVPTLDGKVKLKIEAGTQPNKILRLKGKGIAVYGNPYGKGDQLVQVNIFVPKQISQDDRALLENSVGLRTSTRQKESEKNWTKSIVGDLEIERSCQFNAKVYFCADLWRTRGVVRPLWR